MYSNFVELRKTNEYTYAKVDKTTGFWPFKRTQTIMIFLPKFHVYWREAKTGKYCERYEVESLAERASALKKYHEGK